MVALPRLSSRVLLLRFIRLLTAWEHAAAVTLDFAFRVDDRLVSAQEVISIPWMTICMTDYPLITC